MFKTDLEKAEEPEIKLPTSVGSLKRQVVPEKHLLLLYGEKAVATHSSTLAWKIPWTEEPGRLQSIGSRRVRHDWVTSLWLFTFMLWRRKWQPTPVFLPAESQGQGSLVGCRLWGRRVGHDWSDLEAAAAALLTMPKSLTLCMTTNWKILKEIGTPDHLTCLLRNLYAGQEATVRTRHGPTDRFQIGKEVHQSCILSPCLFNLYTEYIMWNAGLHEAGIRISRRNINNLRYTDDTILMAESKNELKSLLIKVKEENKKLA